MTRRVARLLGAALLSGTFLLPALADQPPVSICVLGGRDPHSGFANPDIADSVVDLRGKLRGKKGVKLVADPAGAEVVIEVTGRTFREGGSISGRASPGARFHAAASDEYRVDAILQVGDFRQPLSGTDDNFWKFAAGDLANRIHRWVQDNRGQLAHRYYPAPQHSASSFPTAPRIQPVCNSPINAGLTTSEVERLLGKPLWQASFEDTVRWSYSDITIIFEKGRVKRCLPGSR